MTSAGIIGGWFHPLKEEESRQERLSAPRKAPPERRRRGGAPREGSAFLDASGVGK